MKTFYIDIDMNLSNPTGLGAISLVARPAVETDFVAFSQDEVKKQQRLQFSEDEHIIKGIAMLANRPIYRYNEDIGEHYIVFTREAIEKMMLKQSMQGLQNSVNLEHQPDGFVNSAFMVQSYIIDRAKGIAPVEFPDATDGSWVVAMKITDADLWDKVKNTDELNGFSIEGLFEYVEQKPKRSYIDEAIDEILADD